MGNMKNSFIISHGVATRFKHLLACAKTFENQWYYNKIGFVLILGGLFHFHYPQFNMCTQLELAMWMLMENFEGWYKKNKFSYCNEYHFWNMLYLVMVNASKVVFDLQKTRGLCYNLKPPF
jgi:hypothetical protein